MLYDNTSRARAKTILNGLFDKIIQSYKIQENSLVDTFLSDLIQNIAFEKGDQMLLDKVKDNFPEYFYLAVHSSRNINKDADYNYKMMGIGLNDYKIDEKATESEAYGLIYEQTIKDVLNQLMDNKITIGQTLLNSALNDLGIKYNPEYGNIVQAAKNFDTKYLDIQHIGYENKHGDFSLSFDGEVQGLVDVKSMNVSRVQDVNKLYQNILKNVPVNKDSSSYKDYMQGLVDSFKYSSSINRRNRSNNVLIFLFRDEAIWTSELLTRMKEDIISDWMDKYEKGKLMFR